MNKKLEQLASIQHDIWSHWMRYLFSQITKNIHVDKLNPDGYIIPSDKVARWSRQMKTKYDELSDQEKQSDRDQVMKFIHLVGGEKSDGVLSNIKESRITLPEIRNKMSPISNLVAMIETDVNRLNIEPQLKKIYLKEIERSKVNIKLICDSP